MHKIKTEHYTNAQTLLHFWDSEKKYFRTAFIFYYVIR